MHITSLLKRVQANQRGITGLETAIILIAFVVVASVFAYTVLSAGIFSAEKGKEAIHSGLEQARGTMEVIGGVILKDTGNPTGSTASDDIVDEVIFTVSNALEGEAIDLTTTVDSNDDGDLSDETGQTHSTIISYIDLNQQVDDIAWTRTEIGKGDGDALLEPGEKMQITVNVSQLSTSLGTDDTFTIEVKPDRGSALVIERTTPSVVDDVMYLN
ncbi:MAG: archaellin/type IV pilin N-terminal domain-containing protein [Dehalococcoidia bacterium]